MRPKMLGGALLAIVMASSAIANATICGGTAPVCDLPVTKACELGPLPDSICRDRWDRSLIVAATLGIGTPVGVAGLVVEYAPVQPIVLQAGVGASFGGLQYEAMLRVRPVALFGSLKEAELTPYFGFGASSGRYAEPAILRCAGDDSCEPEAAWEHALWANAEVGVEGMVTPFVNWRAFIGYSDLMNPRAWTCPNGPCGAYDASTVATKVVYFGGAVGLAL